MSRILFAVGLTSLLGAATAIADSPPNSNAILSQARNPGTLVAFSHDPNCPGCRAFLTGYHQNCDCQNSNSCGCSACSSGCSACDAANGGGVGGGPVAPEDMAGEALLAPDYGFGFGFESAAPGMIGDFFGGSYRMNVVSAGQRTGGIGGAATPDLFTNVAASAGDRRFKIAENNSPFPIDRVFFNYNHFHNALQTADYREANLNRMTMGVEKTFLDRLWSVEMRMPFSNGLNSDQTANTVATTANNVSSEIGNLGLVFKRLLSQSETLSTAAGLGMVFPTGPDARILNVAGTHVVTIQNDAFYLQPFVGMWWTPNERFFTQLSVQADFDTSGNRIDYAIDNIGVVATVQDQALLFLDASFGYWLFRDPTSDAIVTGLAPMVELHHNSTIENPDNVVVGPGITAGSVGGTDTYANPNNRLDVLNLTGALRFELAGISYLTVFAVAPLRQGEEKLFDTEFGVQYTRLY